MKKVKGDLLKSNKNVIAHGCNCQGSMGAGIAKQIKEQYPKAYEKYVKACSEYSADDLLGRVQYVEINNTFYIANLFTQKYYGRLHNGLDYDVFKKCMDKLIGDCAKNHIFLGIPKIGCGLAGGDWNRCEDIISDLESKYDYDKLTLYYL